MRLCLPLSLSHGRQEAGYTLLEVLIVAALLSVVTGALMTPLIVSQRTQLRDTNYALAQQQARTGLDAMVSQIRQAWAILSTGPNSVEMNVNLGGQALHVLYKCDAPQADSTIYRQCLRYQSAAGAALPSTGALVIENVMNGTATDPVFKFGPDPIAPYYMTATIKVPASANSSPGLTHSIAFSSGALMRNENVGY